MSDERRMTVLRAASVLALAGIAMMVWSVLDPRPAPVVLAMSVGQGLGTLSFVLFLFVVALDLLAAKRRPR